jgi:hypothetical protein
MIDKNGKLFGKISVIDILVVALVLVASVFFVTRYLSTRSSALNAGGALDTLEIKFYAEEVNDFVVDSISVGDAAKEMAQYASFGTITDIRTAPSITWVSDSDGNLYASPKEDKYFSVTVTLEAKGKIDATGFTLDGTTYFVGKTVILYLGKAGFQGRIAGVEKVDGR